MLTVLELVHHHSVLCAHVVELELHIPLYKLGLCFRAFVNLRIHDLQYWLKRVVYVHIDVQQAALKLLGEPTLQLLHLCVQHGLDLCGCSIVSFRGSVVRFLIHVVYV